MSLKFSETSALAKWRHMQEPPFFAVLVTALLILLFGLIFAQPAYAEPAKYEGPVTHCSKTYPATKTHNAAFLDVGNGSCWQCPKSKPSRTVFPVTSTKACEKPAHEVFKKASKPKDPTGLIKTDCPPGYFLDIGKRKCYSCGGYARTAHSVTSSKACSKRVRASWSRALEAGDAGCPDGSFRNGLTNKCYSCPAGSYRNANIGSDLTKINACTRCGGEGQKPCPPTVLKLPCEQDLELNIAQGICVPSTKEILRRDAMARIASIGPQLSQAIEKALVANVEDELKCGLEAKSPQSASYADDKVKAAINPCFDEKNQTWTLGAVAQAGALVTGSLETGVAVDVSLAGRTGSQRPAYAYGGAEYGFALAGGASGGINYGCWRDENNALAGDYHGVTLDVVSAAKAGIALSSRSSDMLKPGKGVSFVIGFWYDPHGGDINPARDYLGFTVTVAGGFGADLTGLSYVRGTTGQVTGAFPPPLGKDKVFGTFYKFTDNPSRRNEFIMQGPNQVRIRGLDSAGKGGPFSVYVRDGFSPNVFKARKSRATYTIEDDGSLTWRSNDSRDLLIKLTADS